MLIVFDCDGVLVDSEPLVNRVESRLFSLWGWSLTPAQAGASLKGCSYQCVTDLVERNAHDRPSDWIYQWGFQVAREFSGKLKPIPGVTELIASLLKAGNQVCVASQSPLTRVQMSLEICQLDHFFPNRVFVAAMVARPKPAPDLFLHAASSLGFAPSESLVIEDSPTGVAAARAAQMPVLGFAAAGNDSALADAGATVFQRMADVPELLARRRWELTD